MPSPLPQAEGIRRIPHELYPFTFSPVPFFFQTFIFISQMEYYLPFLIFHEVFPHVIHNTWGGGPRRSTRRRKSSSLLMITALARRAASKITGSFASRSSRSRTECASIWKVSRIQRARAGESCASIHMITLLSQDDQVADLQNGGKR